MRQTKHMSLEQAMADLVKDGESVVMGACLEAMIPFAAAYELIRQKKENLTLIAPISDILFDVMIGAGAVDRLIAAWSGNVSAGLGYNYRRAMEKGVPRPLKVEDTAILPWVWPCWQERSKFRFCQPGRCWDRIFSKPIRSFRSALLRSGEEKLVYVPALTPDVAILGVQRADEFGNAHLWGNFGVAQEAAMASKKVILLAEEIVPGDVITSDPNRLLVPGFKVSAVVHCPGFCHPSPMPGYYQRDHSFFHDYHQESKDEEGFRKWLNQWVFVSFFP